MNLLQNFIIIVEKRINAKLSHDISNVESRLTRKVNEVSSQTNNLQTSLRNVERTIKK